MSGLLRHDPPIHELPYPFREAVKGAHGMTQAPTGLILSSALAAASVACQVGFDVRRPTGNVSPTSLFVLTIAESGERKTTVDNLFTKGLKAAEQQAQIRCALRESSHEASSMLWNEQLTYLRREIRSLIERKVRTIGKSDSEALESIDQAERNISARLSSHLSLKPAPPKSGRVFYMNSSLEAVLESLAGRSRSLALMASEGGVIFDSRVAQQLSSLNVLWDGGDIQVDRVSKPSFSIRDGRLTFSVMVQPGVFRSFLQRKKEQARDIGFLARALTCFPPSSQGKRVVTSSEGSSGSDDHVSAFNKLLEDEFDNGSARARLTLDFDYKAKARWLEYSNQVERALADGGVFEDVRDFASKIADNAARIAAIFTVITRAQNRIDLELKVDEYSMIPAIEVTRWYSSEFLRLFGAGDEISDIHQLSQSLLGYIRRPGRQPDFVLADVVEASDVLKKGPSKLRKAKNLNIAVDHLVSQGRLSVETSSGTRILRIVPYI